MYELASEPPCEDSEDRNLTQDTGMGRVLVIDDDRELCELVREYLIQECFHVASNMLLWPRRVHTPTQWGSS